VTFGVQSVLAIPWSQAQQLSLAAVLDAFLDQSSAPLTGGEGMSPTTGIDPFDCWNEALDRVFQEHRLLAIAACFSAQTNSTSRLSPIAAQSPLFLPGEMAADRIVFPVAARCCKEMHRGWITGVMQILSSSHQIQDPGHDAVEDLLGQDILGERFPDLADFPLPKRPSPCLPVVWERTSEVRHPPAKINLLIAGGDVADPRYRSLQMGLLRRFELIQHRFTFEDRVEQQKLAALKRLAYGASHEINNPLANIATRAQTLIRDESNRHRRQTLETINAQAFRAFDMLASLMHYAAPPTAKTQVVDLVALAQRCMAEVRSHWSGVLSPEWYGSTDPIEVAVDSAQIAVMIQALLRNAGECCAPNGTIKVTVEKTAAESSSCDWIAIRVTDNGLRVPRENLAAMCDPFHSGREAGRGLGFGLAKSLRIVEAHHGWLVLEPQSPSGLQVTAYLPDQQDGA
jgi:signal transduction histidine kinase